MFSDTTRWQKLRNTIDGVKTALPGLKARGVPGLGGGFHPRSQSPAATTFHYDRINGRRGVLMQIGRFFSFQPGRVGQYLSPRVLVVRSPFRNAPEVCYLGFDHLKQAQTFAPNLARIGARFEIRRSQVMPQDYEVRLRGHSDLARTLAYWERRDAGLSVPKDGQTVRRRDAAIGAIAA